MKLIIISAPWCKPCKKMVAQLKAAKESHPALNWEEIDVEQNPEIVRLYDVQSVPLLVFRDGAKDVFTSTGTMAISEIMKRLRIDTN